LNGSASQCQLPPDRMKNLAPSMYRTDSQE
jgi:hypothetical protein